MTAPEAVRVLHVIDSLGRSGGAEQQLVANLQRFADTGLTHEVLCLYPGAGNTRAAEIPATVPVTYLYGQDDRTRNRGRLIARMIGALRERQPDLVHCALPDAALAARVAGRITGTPVVESLVNVGHESVHAVDNEAVTETKLALHRLVDRTTMRWVVRFHALSQEVARSWSDTVGISRDIIDVIPRGVDVSTLPQPEERLAIRLEVRRELGLADDTFLILNIGRQVAQKGQIYAVRAMPKILAVVPEAALISAGSTGAKSELLHAEAESAGGRVQFVGVRSDIPRLLAAADVFVFPSLYEGLGVSLLQAMGAGLPCVTTDRPPMTEVIDHGATGLLVPPQDPDTIADAIIGLAADADLRRRLGEAARARIVERFDADRIAEAIESFYRTALGGRPTRQP